MTSSERRAGWTIARVAGIPVRMHASFLILVGLALLGFFGPPVDGLVWIAIVFSSIVVHELGHATVARRRGLVVRDIVLLPIGGASEIEGLDDDAGRELGVAIAGPLTSIGVAVVGGAAILAGRGSLGSPSLTGGPIADRVVWLNVMLAAFNLLPALPMDGGRVLRALLARRAGYPSATRTAALVSRRLAGVMAVIGLLFMPWLLLIAAFVYVGARAEEAATVAHERLAGLSVRDVMIPIADPSVRPGRDVVRDTDDVEGVLRRLLDDEESLATVVDADGWTVGVVLVDRIAEELRGAA